MKIYVRNLDYDTTEDDLKGIFSEFGEISNINIIKDEISGQPNCSAFIEMPNSVEANGAIQALNKSELKGRKIKVNRAKARDERPQNKFGRDRQHHGHGGSRPQQRPGGNRPARKPGI